VSQLFLPRTRIKKGECGLELGLRSHIDPDCAAVWRALEWRPGDCASSTSNPPCDEMTSSLCWSPTTYSSGGIPILLRTSAKRRLASETFDLRERENMKRRNGQAEGKRRPVKRTKLTDNIFGSTLVYVKLLLLWALVLATDYLLEFRFEYLWPFWLLVRSIYDSFKYQGLAFSVFFICIALTSDMICFLFIPVHWLFFAASTYVWVQYVWHTEKGICLPTVFLWLLFVYIEAAIRLKWSVQEYKLHIDVKNLPFHLDLCRPFAAHCIGYPVVTLGFGFKSYVGYRMRQRRQKEIQKENETYYSLLREALPPGPAREEAFNPSPKPGLEERISAPLPTAGGAITCLNQEGNLGEKSSRSPDKQLPRPDSSPDPSQQRVNGNHGNPPSKPPNSSSSLSNGDVEYLMERRAPPPPVNGDLTEECAENGTEPKAIVRSNSKSVAGGGTRDPSRKGERPEKPLKDQDKAGTGHLSLMIKLESDVKRLKCDLQLSRNRENELRDQIVCYMSSERSLKSEISSLLVEKSGLESRINNLISTRAGEKQTLSSLEKKLAEEKKQRSDFQLKLETERKSKKEAKAEMNLAQQQQSANSATVNKLEVEIKSLRDELMRSESRREEAEEEINHLRKNQGRGDPEKLMAALSASQTQQEQLEHNLSSETKIKMDLFSALGEAKRQLQIRENMLMGKDREILDLKGNIAEMLAVMPGSSMPTTGSVSGLSAAPGGHRAGSGLFTPYGSSGHSGELGIMDLPAGTELNKFGLGLDNMEQPPVTSSLFTPTTYSATNGGGLNSA